MTGEITLRGRVLPVGGLKEKMLAAHRAGLRTIVIPKRNKKDLVDVPREVRRGIEEVILADEMAEVLETALLPACDPEASSPGD
jgi:ATP-dependent Lon protease